MTTTTTEGLVFAVWHGGMSYAQPEIERDVETHASIEDAATEAENRLKCPNFPNTFRYADRMETCVRTPLVDAETSYVDVYLTDPRGQIDPVPDYRLVYDPATDDYQIAD